MRPEKVYMISEFRDAWIKIDREISISPSAFFVSLGF